MTTKKRAWKWCSKFIRLRDALAYCKSVGIDPRAYRVEDLPIICCTCSRVRSFRQMDAGHFISRGSGGSSGVYFDERNIHAQCKLCNSFHQGRALEYLNFMKEKYGQETINELRKLNKLTRKKGIVELRAFALHYKNLYNELLESI